MVVPSFPMTRSISCMNFWFWFFMIWLVFLYSRKWRCMRFSLFNCRQLILIILNTETHWRLNECWLEKLISLIHFEDVRVITHFIKKFFLLSSFHLPFHYVHWGFLLLQPFKKLIILSGYSFKLSSSKVSI
jgi:hypothetical protein